MIEWNLQNIWSLGIGITSLLTTLALFFLIWKQTRQARPKTVTGTRTYCGHCGSTVPNDPIRVVALTDRSYFVYLCSRCEKETLLPTQQFP